MGLHSTFNLASNWQGIGQGRLSPRSSPSTTMVLLLNEPTIIGLVVHT